MMQTCLLNLLTVAPLSLLCQCSNAAATDQDQSIVIFNDNGGWSWFESERVIYDAAAGRLVMSSVANGKGADGESRAGDIDVVSYDIAGRRSQRFTLSDRLQEDDHDSAGLLMLPDGRYLASYSKHAGDNRVRYRTSMRPHDISTWEPETIFSAAGRATYSNLHYLPAANTIFNFYRDTGHGFDPNYLMTTTIGTPRFRYGGRLLTGPEGNNKNHDRPYVKYAGNGVDRIHFIATDHHPRNLVSNGIYHGYISVEQGHCWICRSDGARLGELSTATMSPFQASDFTPLMLGDIVSEVNGRRMTRCWAADLKLDEAGNPVAVFTARVDDQDTDHRFFYGRLNFEKWSIHEFAEAGGYLYASENDYTGLASIDPNCLNRVFISTNVDPRTKTQLPRYELFEGVTHNQGKSWNWKAITSRSTADNIRPVATLSSGNQTALIWMRGIYETYTSYDMEIVGIPDLNPTQVSHEYVRKKQPSRGPTSSEDLTPHPAD
jgi:hypothetical protein